jgi:hypothetical protein
MDALDKFKSYDECLDYSVEGLQIPVENSRIYRENRGNLDERSRKVDWKQK